MTSVSNENNEEERLLSYSEADHSSPERGYDSVLYTNEEDVSNNISNAAINYSENSEHLPQYFAAFSATLMALSSGIVLGWTSPISTYLENGKYHNITINPDEMGWVGSFTTLGALLMCLPTGFLCDAIGRKTVLLSLIVPFLIGWSLLICAKSVAMLYAGRIINGLAVGSCCVAAPLYTSEIAQKDIRGTLGSYFQLMVVIGVFYAYLVGNLLEPTEYTISCIVIPLIAFFTMLTQPETPLYLMKKGKQEKALISLQKLRGPNCNVEVELHSIESGIKNDSFTFITAMRMLKQRAIIRAVIISFGLMFFQQFCGINAVVFYTGDIFDSSGIKLNTHIATIAVGCFQAIATFISSLIVDKSGRRKLLILSGSVMSLSTILLGVFYTLKNKGIINNDNISIFGVLPVICLCVFVVVFSLGYGPIPWMISAEIFTPETKSIAGSAAGAFNWFLAFLITKFYLNIVEQMGEDTTFYFFGACSMVGVIFVYFFVIETKGKSLGQIQAELSR